MKWVRRIAIAVAGGTVLLIGIAMIVLPGPAIIVVPAGLAILALEFAWAKHWLHKIREHMPKRFAKMVGKGEEKEPLPKPPGGPKPPDDRGQTPGND